MLSLADHPLPRYPEARALEDDLGRWAVAQVRSRQEKSLARDLANAGIPYHLPMVQKLSRRRDNGKPRKSVLPLFPGYMAVAVAGEEHRQRLYGTARLARIIPVRDQTRFVRELGQVQRTLGSGIRVALAPAFTAGQWVRVRSGPLMGLEGEVASVRGHDVFVIWVRMFDQAVSVELDGLDLEVA